MSGRDLKMFVTSHRVYSNSDEPDKLLNRVSNGLGSNKYGSVDYEKLKAMAAEKKFASHKSLIKMKKLEEMSRQTKENNITKQHKMVWHKEFSRLNSLRKRLQTEIDVLYRECLFDPCCERLFKDLEDYETMISSEFTRFKHDTCNPVWELREDLQFFLSENQTELRNGTPEVVDKHVEIQCLIDNVKQQQQHMLEKLKYDQISLEQELKTGGLAELWHPHSQDLKLPREQGIPEEAFDLECPDLEFKASIIQQFILIDEKYLERLTQLEEQHAAVLRLSETGDWCEEEHFIFQAVHEQYPNELPNRRALILDRFKKHLPHKTTFHLLEHERWWLGYKYYCNRHRSILNDWQRDRRELMTKTKVVFSEACITHDLETAVDERRQKQIDLCNTLYEKVVHWREQKEEAMLLESKIEERRRKVIEEQMKKEEEKEKKRRKFEKQKIQEFQDDQASQRQLADEEEQRKLEEMNRQLAEQAEYDRQRVKYRDEMELQKCEEKKAKELERLIEEEEREQRLETLREQVRVVAEVDPARVVKNTEAWRNRLLREEADVQLQRPLFNVHTFTEKQVIADPRVRLETKLREAGLMQTDYARQVMSKMKPVHPPRRDMESTVFKQDPR